MARAAKVGMVGSKDVLRGAIVKSLILDTNNNVITRMFSLKMILTNIISIRVAIGTTRVHKYIVTLATINPNIYGIYSNLRK